MVNGEVNTMNGEDSVVNGYSKTGKTLSQAAIGRALGLAPSTMTKHKAAGMPMDSVESARAWHKAHTNIAQRKPASRLADAAHQAASLAHPAPPIQQAAAMAPVMVPTNPSRVDDMMTRPVIHANEVRFDGFPLGEDFDAARTREKIATANLAEIEEAALRGTYLVKADFERYLFNAGRMLRDTLTNCARRIGAEVSGLDTAEACEAVIDREHRAALASFSQQLRHTLKIEVESNPLSAHQP